VQHAHSDRVGVEIRGGQRFLDQLQADQVVAGQVGDPDRVAQQRAATRTADRGSVRNPRPQFQRALVLPERLRKGVHFLGRPASPHRPRQGGLFVTRSAVMLCDLRHPCDVSGPAQGIVGDQPLGVATVSS